MEKRKFEKEGKIIISILIFFHTIYLAILKVYTKFEDPGSNRSREICDIIVFFESKKNGQIKGIGLQRLSLISEERGWRD